MSIALERLGRPCVRFLVALLAIGLSSGCGMTFRLNPEARTDNLPPTTKHPLHAGIYYSPQFASSEQTRVSGEHTWIAQIGAASVKLFDSILPRVFEKTSRASKLTAEELSSLGVDVVIAPTLEHFDFRLGLDEDSDRYSVSYRMTLYSNRGVPSASWIVFGDAPSRSRASPSTTIWTWMEDDMADAAVKFLQGFEREAGPAFAAIAKSRGEQAPPIDPGSVLLTAERAELPNLDQKQLKALHDAGVLTLKVTAKNQIARGLVMRASDMRLRLKEGQVIEPSTVSSVLSALDKAQFDALAPLAGPIIAVLVQANRDAAVQRERGLQVRVGSNQLFGERSIIKDKEESGIVLFRMPAGTKMEGATLTAWVVDPPFGTGTQTEVALPTTAR